MCGGGGARKEHSNILAERNWSKFHSSILFSIELYFEWTPTALQIIELFWIKSIESSVYFSWSPSYQYNTVTPPSPSRPTFIPCIDIANLTLCLDYCLPAIHINFHLLSHSVEFFFIRLYRIHLVFKRKYLLFKKWMGKSCPCDTFVFIVFILSSPCWSVSGRLHITYQRTFRTYSAANDTNITKTYGTKGTIIV